MQKFDTLDAYWHDIHDIPTLNFEEEQLLAERIAKGDEAALNKLVTSNLRYVVSVARQYYQKNDGVDIDDLISEGNIALMTAARKWQPKESSFISYASGEVKRAMERSISRQDDAFRVHSTDAPIRQGQTSTFGDMLKAGKPFTEDEAENNEISDTLKIALRYLSDREKQVIKSFYGIQTSNRLTMAEIGEEMGLKRERIRQIRKTAERKMRRIMKRNSNN